MALTNSDGELSLGGLVETIQNIEDQTAVSLFQYTKRSTIMSRVFIEQSLAGEDILTPLLMNIMNIYVGQVMTALSMNQYIYGSKKVRDIMSVVATESLDSKVDLPQTIQPLLQEYFLGKDADTLLSRRSRMQVDPKNKNNAPGGSVIDNSKKTERPDEYDPDERPNGSTGDIGIIAPEYKDANLPSGRIISVDFQAKNSNGKESRFKINMYLQLLPRFIPAEVANQFVAANFTPTLAQRWTQMSVGEISFFKDFLFSSDRRRQRYDALRKDKTGALKEMVERQQNNYSKVWWKYTGLSPDKMNIANTILIFNKQNFDKACSNAGLHFNNYNSRQKFFDKTFSMIVATVDPMYNRIEMFFHSLPGVSVFTFDQMKKNAKTEQTDMVSLMRSFAQGMAPKF